ncbi:MAG TPA: hypothetical protein VI142_03215 [Gaiellaceae bacterium]
MQKLIITGIAALVSAAAFAATAGAEIKKPAPGLLGPPVPAPTAPKPGSTTPGPIKLGPPVLKPTLTAPALPGKPSLTTPAQIRVPAF